MVRPVAAPLVPLPSSQRSGRDRQSRPDVEPGVSGPRHSKRLTDRPAIDRKDRSAKSSSRLLERLKLLLAANRLIHPLLQDWQTHLIRLLWGSPARLEIVSLSLSR